MIFKGKDQALLLCRFGSYPALFPPLASESGLFFSVFLLLPVELTDEKGGSGGGGAWSSVNHSILSGKNSRNIFTAGGHFGFYDLFLQMAIMADTECDSRN
jgi:hypothetical protein